MRFAFFVVALALGATMQAKPEGEYGKEGDGRYFESNLDGLQGALEDISKAGEDLVTLKTKLERLVDDSSLIYKAESVLESSVGKDVYINAWKSGELIRDSMKFNIILKRFINTLQSNKKFIYFRRKLHMFWKDQ